MRQWLLALALAAGCTGGTRSLFTDSSGATTCADCVCAAGEGCDFQCPAGAETCEVTCKAGSDCTVDCQDAATCKVSCAQASVCAVDCADAFSCDVACPTDACAVANCELDVDCNVSCAGGAAADPAGLGVTCGEAAGGGGGGIEGIDAELPECPISLPTLSETPRTPMDTVAETSSGSSAGASPGR